MAEIKNKIIGHSVLFANTNWTKSREGAYENYESTWVYWDKRDASYQSGLSSL